MTQLQDVELQRIDGLLSAAREWSGRSWPLALVAVGLVAIASPTVELGGLPIAVKVALPILYCGVWGCTVVAQYYRRLALRHGPVPKLRVPHPWLLLRFPVWSQSIVLGLPLLMTGVVAEFRLVGPYGGLTLASLAALRSSDLLGAWIRAIRDRIDERGGPATFSIWLLYFCRADRHVSFMLLLLSPLLWNWPRLAMDVGGIALVNVFLISIVRLIGSLMYPTIDRFGVRWGFAATSVHYSSNTGGSRSNAQAAHDGT